MHFLPTLGQLPNTGLNLFLILISGVTEGFGLALFVPLLHFMAENNVHEIPKPFSYVLNGFDRIGIVPGVVPLLITILVFALISMGLAYLQRKVLILAKSRHTANLRNSLFHSLLESSWGHSSRRQHGEIVNLLSLECNRAGAALGYELMAVAISILIAVYLVFSIFISWQLTLIAGLFGLFMFLIIRPLSRQAKSLGKRATTLNREFGVLTIEYLRVLKLLKATASEQRAERKFDIENETLFLTAVNSELNGAKVHFISQALPVLMLTIVIGVSHEILQTPAPIILVFLIFITRLAPRVGQFQQQLQSYHLHSPAIDVVTKMIEACSDNREAINSDGKTFDRIKESIELDHVTFEYSDGDAPAVKDISMTIGSHQIVAIAGVSGAGKSTLIDILTGLRKPRSGYVRVDGVDLNAFDLASWRRRIGIVTQETMMFNASLRENLMFFTPGASEADIAYAVSAAHLVDVIDDLPNGLETVLGESSVRFSGGQKQRIALARALVGKPELLLLDEATSALDNESERYVQDAIRAAADTMSVVVIAHRLSTVRRADMIYVMEKGQMVENGNYAELINLGGRFAELQKLEFSENALLKTVE